MCDSNAVPSTNAHFNQGRDHIAIVHIPRSRCLHQLTCQCGLTSRRRSRVALPHSDRSAVFCHPPRWRAIRLDSITGWHSDKPVTLPSTCAGCFRQDNHWSPTLGAHFHVARRTALVSSSRTQCRDWAFPAAAVKLWNERFWYAGPSDGSFCYTINICN